MDENGPLSARRTTPSATNAPMSDQNVRVLHASLLVERAVIVIDLNREYGIHPVKTYSLEQYVHQLIVQDIESAYRVRLRFSTRSWRSLRSLELARQQH